LFADGAGSITITYDSNVYGDGWSPTADRLGLSTDPGAWTAVGSFLSELGGSDWNNADPFGAMTSLGGGIYELTVTLPAGNYDWKGVVSGSWDSISWDQRSVGTANWNFNTDAINDTVIFRVNALDGTAQISVVPEPSTLALATLSGLAILVGLRRRS
jgi:hypothetical protein